MNTNLVVKSQTSTEKMGVYVVRSVLEDGSIQYERFGTGVDDGGYVFETFESKDADVIYHYYTWEID